MSAGEPRLLARLVGPQAGIVAALVGVALPLEFMPVLSGVRMYATPLQALEIFAELGAAFLVAGVVLALACTVVAALVALLLRRPIVGVAKLAGRSVTILVLAMFAIHALKTWLYYSGIGSSAWLMGHSALWALAGLVVAVAWLVHCVRRDVAPTSGAVNVLAICVLLLSGCGLVADAIWPLMSTRALGAQQAHAHADPRQPDVVLVTIDTFSARHASLYGYDRPTTPGLEALARQATVFDHFYSNGNFTTSSIASILLSERPWSHRVFVGPSEPFDSDTPHSLLADFHQAGYRTLSVATNTLASPPRHREMRYVDEQVMSDPWLERCPWDIDIALKPLSPQSASIVGVLGFWSGPRHAILARAIAAGRCPASGEFDNVLAFEQAKAMLQRTPTGQPSFLWVHLTPPHDPYAPAAPWLGMFDAGKQARTVVDSTPVYHYLGAAVAANQRQQLQGRYDEALRYTDDSVADFMQWLKATGRFDRSVIMVSADHGESFEHSYGGHGGPELYDDIVHIPLLIKEPGQTTGQRIRAPAEQVDLLPTLADLAGVPVPVAAEGQSLKGLMHGGNRTQPVWTMSFELQSRFAPLTRGSVAMVDGPWKLHLVLGEPNPTTPTVKRARLFNTDIDPGELDDIAAQNADRVQSMTSVTMAEFERHRAAR
jgi:arylsulfatase A-like enzyme